MAYNYLDNVGLQHLITSIKSLLAGKADQDHTHASATTSAAGFMSASDKTTLDGLSSDAQGINGILNGLSKSVAQNEYNISSTTKEITLTAASWSSGSYTITDDLITETSNQEVIPAMGITPDQYSALCAAQLVDGGQTTGSLTLKALGTVPTIDIPIRIIYRGVK